MVNKSCLIIWNPHSGAGFGKQVFDGLLSQSAVLKPLLESERLNPLTASDSLTTNADGSWKNEFKLRLETAKYGGVIVIGGDGTLSEASTVLYEFGKTLSQKTQPCFVPLPGGRGNDFIRTLCGYRRDEGDFWSWLRQKKLSWKKTAIDLGSCGGRLFLNMASVGYGGSVVENAQNRKSFWSKSTLVYQIEGALGMFTSGGCRGQVQVDGSEVFSGEFFGAFVGNGASNGSGLYWTWQAKADDGLLDAICFGRPGLVEMGRSISEVKAKRPPTFNFKYSKGKQISFYFDRPTPLELDGDFVGSSLNHEFSCVSSALSAWHVS